MTETQVLTADAPRRREADLREAVRAWPAGQVRAWRDHLRAAMAHVREAQALHHDPAFADLQCRLAELENIADEELLRHLSQGRPRAGGEEGY
jgi:hypothetical protein